MELNERLSNIIENTACRVAQLRGGRLSPHHVMPYLPVSLEMLCDGLNAVVAERFLKTEPGTLRYCFPPRVYPQNLYRKNQAVIRSYPASVMEDMEQRIVRILFVLGCIFIAMLALVFWGIPFPFLVPAFLVVAPITALSIWRYKSRV